MAARHTRAAQANDWINDPTDRPSQAALDSSSPLEGVWVLSTNGCGSDSVIADGKLVLAMQVMIVDFDVHHGNGTQDAFYEDPSVLFVDMHEEGVWPGSGKAAETGTGPGRGATINIPLPGMCPTCSWPACCQNSACCTCT